VAKLILWEIRNCGKVAAAKSREIELVDEQMSDLRQELVNKHSEEE
jgi:hypothetical protein